MFVVYSCHFHTQASLEVGARGEYDPLSMPLWSRPVVIISLPVHRHEAEGSHV
jgi:hypothetical protein